MDFIATDLFGVYTVLFDGSDSHGVYLLDQWDL